MQDSKTRENPNKNGVNFENRLTVARPKGTVGGPPPRRGGVIQFFLFAGAPVSPDKKNCTRRARPLSSQFFSIGICVFPRKFYV